MHSFKTFFSEAKRASVNLLDSEGLQFSRKVSNRYYDPRQKKYVPEKWKNELEHNVQKQVINGFEAYFVDHRTTVQNFEQDNFLKMTEEFRKRILRNHRELHGKISNNIRNLFDKKANPSLWDIEWSIKWAIKEQGNIFSYTWQANSENLNIRRKLISNWNLKSPGEEMTDIILGKRFEFKGIENSDKNRIASIVINQILERFRTSHVKIPDERVDPHPNNGHYAKLIQESIQMVKQIGARTEMFRVPIIVRYIPSISMSQGTASAYHGPVVTIYVSPHTDDALFVGTLMHEFGHQVYNSLGADEQKEIYNLARQELQFSDYGKVTYKSSGKEIHHESGNEWLAEFFSHYSKNKPSSPREAKIAHKVFEILRHGFAPQQTHNVYRNYPDDKDREGTIEEKSDITRHVLRKFVFDFYAKPLTKSGFIKDSIDHAIDDIVENNPNSSHRELKRILLKHLRVAEKFDKQPIFKYFSQKEIPAAVRDLVYWENNSSSFLINKKSWRKYLFDMADFFRKMLKKYEIILSNAEEKDDSKIASLDKKIYNLFGTMEKIKDYQNRVFDLMNKST